jgi:hypothetical protein
MATMPIPKPKAVKATPGAPKFKLPTPKMASPKTPKMPTTGIKGYMASSGSKLFNSPKPPKNGLAQFNQ